MKREREEAALVLFGPGSDKKEAAVWLISTEQLRYGQRIAEELIKRTMIRGPFIQELLMELLDED